MKKIILIMMLMVGAVSMAQEKTELPFYETADYLQIKKYYLDMVSSGKIDGAENIRKQFLDKIGRDNFENLKKSNLSIKDWVNANFSKTSFKTIAEANDLVNKMDEFENEATTNRNKIMPLIKKITDKVGYENYTKRLQADLKTEIKL